MSDLTGLSAQCVEQLLRHLSGQCVQSHGTMEAKIGYLVGQASEGIGSWVDVDKDAVLETLSLVVQKTPDADLLPDPDTLPWATP